MKKITFFSIILMAFISSACTQAQWDEIVYHYQEGSVPPPYFYSYDITIGTDGTGTLVYSPNYGNDTTWVYNLTISESDMSKLNEAITRSNVLNETIPELPNEKIPDGGPSQNITITLHQDPSLDQTPPKITTPYFPEESYKETLTGIYSIIKNMVPDSVWTEINGRKAEYIKNNDK
jgi:hypothetical protein